MENPKAAEEVSLQIKHAYGVPREKVFQAWVEEDQVRQWFGPKDVEVSFVEMDVRIGGRYKISFRNPQSGEMHVVVGEYVEINPPERLVFTWRWENTPEDVPDTLVTVEFAHKGDGTELVLTHERLPSVEARGHHRDGWIGSLDCLAELLAG